MSEISKSMDKKSFFMLAAYAAESTNDQFIVDRFDTSIKKYKEAKKANLSEEKLDAIFVEITLLSYVTVIKMLDRKADDLITDMVNVDRVLNLIKPPKN